MPEINAVFIDSCYLARLFEKRFFKMSDSETPKSKYQCLLDAAANSGLADKLPPIKPETTVREGASMSSYPSGWGGLTAAFDYDAIDGKEYKVQVVENDFKGTAHNSFFVLSSLDKASPWRLDPDGRVGLARGDLEVSSGKEDLWGGNADGKPPTPGTVGETIKKILKCLTPGVS